MQIMDPGVKVPRSRLSGPPQDKCTYFNDRNFYDMVSLAILHSLSPLHKLSGVQEGQ